MKNSQRYKCIALILCFVWSSVFLDISAAATRAATHKSLPKEKRQAQTSLDPELEQMRQQYDASSAMTAEFTQSQKNLTLGNVKVSTGRVFIKRPRLFRWETLAPDASVLACNGQKAWFYTPPFREGEKGQVIIKRASDVQSQLAVDLIIGGPSAKKAFDFRRVDAGHYKLLPLKSSGDIEFIELYIEKQTNLVYKLHLVSTNGNETTIDLKRVELKANIPSSVFNFEIPSNTEVVK